VVWKKSGVLEAHKRRNIFETREDRGIVIMDWRAYRKSSTLDFSNGTTADPYGLAPLPQDWGFAKSQPPPNVTGAIAPTNF